MGVPKQRLCTICGCGEKTGKNNSGDVRALRSSGSGSEKLDEEGVSLFMGGGEKKILLAANPQSASFQKPDNYLLNAGGEKKRKALRGNKRSDCEISDSDTITVLVQN